MGALVDSNGQKASTKAQPNLKNLFILVIAVDVLIIAGASLWLGAPETRGWLAISRVSLWHNGSATFSLTNYGAVYYTITQAKVSGPGVENGVTVSLFSGNVVSYKSALNLTVFFSAFVWQDGGQYDFVLTDLQADHFTASIIA